jgi:RNA polymerase sigma-70 factor, ECF subfamily
MAITGTGHGPDFADVYREQLVPVWRYVRSRIRDHHEAQDVTSEVFARAWRSWGGYDPGRGDVAPWLLRIAQRTVVDWNRKHNSRQAVQAFDPDLVEDVQTSPNDLPEAILLAKEVLAEVSQALGQLSSGSGMASPCVSGRVSRWPTSAGSWACRQGRPR